MTLSLMTIGLTMSTYSEKRIYVKNGHEQKKGLWEGQTTKTSLKITKRVFTHYKNRFKYLNTSRVQCVTNYG